MESPLFSIIVASYNNGHFLSECIDSLIRQTYTNIEIIIVDDASTDQTPALLSLYQKKDSRIKIVRIKRNQGVGHTKSVGVKHSSGLIVGTIGADDALTENAIETMVLAHQSYPEASLIYSTHYLCDQNLNVVEVNQSVSQIPSDSTYLTYENYSSDTVSSFRTFKRSSYDHTQGYDMKFTKAVDKDIIFKLEEVGSLVFLDQPLYFYRLHKRNISRNKNALIAAQWEVKAKEKAYLRRKGGSIPNISKSQLLDEYYFVFKSQALEFLKNKEFRRYLKTLKDFFTVFRNPFKVWTFFYYTMKKSHQPGAYSP